MNHLMPYIKRIDNEFQTKKNKAKPAKFKAKSRRNEQKISKRKLDKIDVRREVTTSRHTYADE